MTTFIFANNIQTTLAGAVSTSATTITLASTANLPTTIPSGSVLVITLNDAATRQNFEVVYATARSGATLTVLRAQEGTAALTWLTGDYAFSPPTAGQQASFGQLAESNTWTGQNIFTDPVAVAAATATGQAVNLGQFQSGQVGQGYWIEFPNGWISQTFLVAVNPTGVTINLPKPFTAAAFGFTTGIIAGTQASLANNGYVGGQFVGLNQIQLFSVNGSPNIYVTAVGI